MVEKGKNTQTTRRVVEKNPTTPPPTSGATVAAMAV
jgi:hypothetical protein